jgi:predicted RNA-binding Zn-ribbon protein involved in translation (DUF1610 family)
MSKPYITREVLERGMANPCPKCGAKKLIKQEVRDTMQSPTGVACIVCAKCGVDGPPVPCNGFLDLGSMIVSLMEAIGGWNSEEWREQFKEESKS